VVTKIGGDGKQCWVNGKNWIGMRSGRDLSFRPYTGEAEAGRWRVEVRPTERAENDRFLHVIQVGLGSRNPEPTAARCVKVEAGTRVDVDLGDGRRASIVFEDGIGGTICIRGGSGPTIEASLAEGVLPNIPIPR
jgi:hypothetical protein